MKWIKDVPEGVWKHHGDKVHIEKCVRCGKNYYTILEEEEGKCPDCERSEGYLEECRDRIGRSLTDLAEREKGKEEMIKE